MSNLSKTNSDGINISTNLPQLNITISNSKANEAAINLAKTQKTDAVTSGLVKGISEKPSTETTYSTTNPSIVTQEGKTDVATTLSNIQKTTNNTEVVSTHKKTLTLIKKSEHIFNKAHKNNSCSKKLQKKALKKRSIYSFTSTANTSNTIQTSKPTTKLSYTALPTTITNPTTILIEATTTSTIITILSLILLLSAIVGAACNSNSDNGARIDIPYEENGYLIGSETSSTVYWPDGWGVFHTPWDRGTNQAEVFDKWVAAGCVYTEGIATLDGRYLVATTTTFGTVGDRVDFHTNTGDVIPCIIADAKNPNDPGCTKWGHSNGKCVLEFEVEDSYYQRYTNAGIQSTPSWTIPDARKYYASKESNEPCYLEYAINLERGGGTSSAIANAAIAFTEDDSIGYCNGSNKGIWDKRNHNPDMDCSSFVYYSCIEAGWTEEQLGSEPFGTDTEMSILPAAGFTQYDYVDVCNDLQPGDILVHEPYAMGGTGAHTAIYIGDGKIAHAIYDFDNAEHDGDGNEVTITELWTNWEYVFRAPTK